MRMLEVGSRDLRGFSAAMAAFGDVSVVIVTHNSEEVLAECLGSLAALLPGAEVLVVDNGSTDGTVEIAARWPDVRVVAGHGNVGFGGGVNRGAEAATRPLLLVMNPDATVVAADGAALEELARADRIGAVGCTFADGDGRRHDLAFAAWGWRAELAWSLMQFFIVPREVRVRRPRGRPGRRWVAGAGCLLRRDELRAAGGLDERLFLYYEDFELCRRYRERGLPIGTTDALTLTHAGHRSSPRDERTMAAYTLMSLIECAGDWDGPRAASRAAGLCLRLLEAIEAVGGACRAIPLLGPRAAKKRDEAASVRHALDAIANRPPAAGAYPVAAAALRHRGLDGTQAGPVDEIVEPDG
jgi:N-acetylglucosaminyl-diphospho-decaprenol L-rhamnosyltransferase